MVLSYNYSNRNRWRRRTNAPPSLAILIAMAVRWCDTARIAWWRRSRAFIKATKRCHRVTTPSVLLQWPPGQRKQNDDARCVHFADHFDALCHYANQVGPRLGLRLTWGVTMKSSCLRLPSTSDRFNIQFRYMQTVWTIDMLSQGNMDLPLDHSTGP